MDLAFVECESRTTVRKIYGMRKQRTLQRSIIVKGIGLHSGKDAAVTLKPAKEDFGIQFVRSDISGARRFKASFDNIFKTQLQTTLGQGKDAIATVEHLLAAVYGMGIDNMLVEVSGPELPIIDGSSQHFCEKIAEAGVVTQKKAQPFIRLKRRIEIKVDGKWAIAEPHTGLDVSATIDWDHPIIGYQQFNFVEGQTSFGEIASARTFGFLKEAEMLRRMGLALGASLDNAVVLDDLRVLNEDGLRFEDEFVRHKVLDALGDFMLAGFPLRAKVRLYRAGHDLHAKLLAAIFMDERNYEIVRPVEVEQEQERDLPLAVAAY